jgi:hypothetical protein
MNAAGPDHPIGPFARPEGRDLTVPVPILLATGTSRRGG